MSSDRETSSTRVPSKPAWKGWRPSSTARHRVPAKSDFIRRVNVEGTDNIADACLELNVQRMVYVGTANSFGKEPHAPELADERCNYTSHVYGLDYMDSKREAQELLLRRVAEDGLPAIVVNPTFMIDRYDSKRIQVK